jgi:hypothetical protein
MLRTAEVNVSAVPPICLATTQVCKQALYIPCFSHSLNRFRNSAADSCQGAAKFIFYFVHKKYIFISIWTSMKYAKITSTGKENGKNSTIQGGLQEAMPFGFEAGHDDIQSALDIAGVGNEKPLAKAVAKNV